MEIRPLVQGPPDGGWQQRVLEMIAEQKPLPAVLSALALHVEREVPHSFAVVLLVEGQALRVAAAPSLASDHVAAIEAMGNGPPESPCTAAIRLQQHIIVPRLADPGWADLREFSQAHGIRAWWSVPIPSSSGAPQGTFALQRRREGPPTSMELQVLDLAAGLARIAIEANNSNTARRQAEIRRSSIVAAALDAIVSMDHEGCVLEWNPSAERIFGYTREEAMGRAMADLIVPPDLRAAHWRGLRRYLATGEARVLGRKIEISAQRKDGSTLPVELAIVQLATEGHPTFTAFIRDLSERERRTEELRDRNERLRAIFEQVSVGIAQFDLAGRFILVNDRYCQLAGRSREAILALRIDDVTAPEHVERDRHLFDQVVARGDSAVMDSRFLRPDRADVWVRRSLSLVRDGHGRPQLVVGVVQEITQQKAAEAELQRINATLEDRVARRTQELETANRDLQSFSYVVSHDLRAPLRTISFVLDRSRNGAPDAADLALAQAALDRMAGLIDGLLVLAKVSKEPLRHEPVDLSRLADQTIAQLRAVDPGRQVWVQPGLHATGDPRLLASVLENLLSNAWKFTASTPEALIEFGAEDAGGRRAFFVRDNGPGFEEADAPKLFEPFTRLAPDSGPPGLGIGLATVRRIVERHGGSVWAHGRTGAGATFYFTLAE